MKDFWLSCGHHLLDRDEGGGLVVTDDFLKVYFARPELTPPPERLIEKTTFDSTRAPGFLERLPADHTLVVTGCEAHICVLQTVLGLIDAGRRVYVVADAVGSRKAQSKRVALRRMAQAGATIVTTEMVLFEWVGDARHPRFKEISALVK